MTISTAVWSDFERSMEKQQDGDVTRDTEIEAVKNSIANILTTNPGSRRMLPEFAVNINKLLFEPMDEITARMIGETLLDAINTWDDRVNVEGLDIIPNYDHNQYDCKLSFRIVTSREVQIINFILST